MQLKNQVQLITYADSMGGTLAALRETLEGELNGLFGGVHILPPFVSSGDRGFAPVDYNVIEPAFGSWADIAAIAKSHPVMLDLMVNHVSRRSPMFRDYLEKGSGSAYADFFLTPEKVWPQGEPPAEDLQKIVLRRACPWSTYQTADGSSVKVWTTFGPTDPSEQIDLDVNNPGVQAYFKETFDFFAQNGVSVIRLDAVGYVMKQAGTSCFMVEPQMSRFLDWMRELGRQCGLAIISEIHAKDSITKALAAKGHPGYDFLMPFTVLYTLLARDKELLYTVLADRPHNQLVTLDCHDGVPVQPDMNGWITAQQAWLVVNQCKARGARFSKMHSSEMHDSAYPDVHQICGTYYTLLGEDDDRYIAARAIQFFVPGIPQLYYVGLFAGKNDPKQMAAEQDDRGLNRHNYTVAEMGQALGQPVVRRLTKLIKLRNSHPAFGGSFAAQPGAQDCVCLAWRLEEQCCQLTIDLKTMESRVRYTTADGVSCEEIL